MSMTDGYPFIFYTLVHIMMDVYHKDPKASFFFIGAEDEQQYVQRITDEVKAAMNRH